MVFALYQELRFQQQFCSYALKYGDAKDKQIAAFIRKNMFKAVCITNMLLLAF